MKHEFKPGDLALVVRAQHPENNGKVVELIRFDDSEMIDHAPYADCQTENLDRLPCWLVLGEIVTTRILGKNLGERTTTVAAFAERCLMPIQGDEDPDATLATERPSELVVA